MPDANDQQDATNSGVAVERPVRQQSCDPNFAFVTPQLKSILQVWEAKRGVRVAPCRTDFSMRDLKFALANVAVLALVREGTRTRFRVQMMGSQIDTYIGAMTGKFVDEAVPAAFADKWTGLWAGAIETGRVQRSVGRVEFGGKSYYVAESLFAPLAADGEHPDAVLVSTYFHLQQSDRPEQSAISRALLDEISAAA